VYEQLHYECARIPSRLCVLSKLVGSDLIFVSFDLEHGAGRELTRMPIGYTNWGLSPDGSRLAVFLDRHRVRFFHVNTGGAKDVVGRTGRYRMATGRQMARVF